MIYLISDTHFGHKNILKYETTHRPFSTIEEHDEELVRRWNAVVTENDTVWHLGDVALGRDGINIVERLNGNKNLVLGNHDKKHYHKYFDKVVPHHVLKGNILLSHYPVHEQQLTRYKYNIHGHLHSKVIDHHKYFNVSVECIGLKPVALEVLLRSSFVGLQSHKMEFIR
jgi:calcineurin-like phosphoesterase family protein